MSWAKVLTLEDLYNEGLAGWIAAKAKEGLVSVYISGGGLGNIEVQKEMIVLKLMGTRFMVPDDFKWGALSATPTLTTKFPSPADRSMLPPGEFDDEGIGGFITISSEILGKYALGLPGTRLQYPRVKKTAEEAGQENYFDIV